MRPLGTPDRLASRSDEKERLIISLQGGGFKKDEDPPLNAEKAEAGTEP